MCGRVCSPIGIPVFIAEELNCTDPLCSRLSQGFWPGEIAIVIQGFLNVHSQAQLRYVKPFLLRSILKRMMQPWEVIMETIYLPTQIMYKHFLTEGPTNTHTQWSEIIAFALSAKWLLWKKAWGTLHARYPTNETFSPSYNSGPWT